MMVIPLRIPVDNLSIMRSTVPARNMNPLNDMGEVIDRKELRRHGRIRTQGLTAKISLTRSAIVDNVSASGLGLRYNGRARHQVGDRIRLKLQWRKSTIPVDVVVVSVRSEGGTTILGLEFDPSTQGQANAIRNLAIQARRWMD